MSTAWFRRSVDGPRHGVPEWCTTLTAVPPGAQRCVRQEFFPGHYKILTVPRADTAINLSGDSGCRLILCKADLNLNPCLNRLVGLFHLPDYVGSSEESSGSPSHLLPTAKGARKSNPGQTNVCSTSPPWEGQDEAFGADGQGKFPQVWIAPPPPPRPSVRALTPCVLSPVVAVLRVTDPGEMKGKPLLEQFKMFSKHTIDAVLPGVN